MKSLSLALFLSVSSVLAGPVQKPGLRVPASARAQRDAVQNIFTTSYQGYKQFAFGHDDLSPVSESFSDGRNGWGASIVDAMDTMLIMGLNDSFTEALNFTSNIDFNVSNTPDTVSVFETTIRYLGGMLSAYELSGNQFPVLIDKAKQVADKMAFAWSLPGQKVPFGFIDFATNTPTQATSNIAEAGTLSLEWFTLSQFTGNDTYRALTEGSVRQVASNPDPLPGLPAQGIDPASGQSVGAYVSWGGGSDSYLEYLIKYARLTNTNDPIFADTWHTAVDSSIKSLLRISTVGNHLYIADQDDSGQIRHIGSHLACFYGGNWLLGGRLLNNQTIVNLALQLVDACWNTYSSTATGIGMESFAYISSDGNFTGMTPPSPGQVQFFNRHGFYLTNSFYAQRPEVLESNFYAWRVTGDTKYLDRAASAVKSFNKFLKSNAGYAELNDVNDVSSPQADDMPSFWLAETLKYLYLTFDDPNHISLDEYVFNTEAHPLKAPPAKPVYGSGSIQSPSTGKPFTKHTGPPLPAVSPEPFISNGFIG